MGEDRSWNAERRGPRVLVLSCSLNPGSRSAVLASLAAGAVRREGGDAVLLDLRSHPLPLCDGCDVSGDPNVSALVRLVGGADAVLFATPVYNYDASAAAKNAVELAGKALRDKVVGFLCSAGGRSSYMAVMGLAASLMLDFRCVVVPRFVYATKSEVEGASASAEVERRVGELAREAVRIAGALRASAAAV